MATLVELNQSLTTQGKSGHKPTFTAAPLPLCGLCVGEHRKCGNLGTNLGGLKVQPSPASSRSLWKRVGGFSSCGLRLLRFNPKLARTGLGCGQTSANALGPCLHSVYLVILGQQFAEEGPDRRSPALWEFALQFQKQLSDPVPEIAFFVPLRQAFAGIR
jgi:hypothetical protein